jgi:hypothetical protein
VLLQQSNRGLLQRLQLHTTNLYIWFILI